MFMCSLQGCFFYEISFERTELSPQQIKQLASHQVYNEYTHRAATKQIV